MEQNSTYSPQQLKHFIVQVFLAVGLPEKDAVQASDVLVAADLRGIDSHGIARLEGYLRLIEKRRVNVKPQIKFTRRYKSTANLDADGALGLVSAPYAMEYAMEMAEEYGSGWIAIQNSNHFGIAAYHAMMAADKEYIGYASTNASPLVAPARGKERMLGTNPICYAIPTGNKNHFVVDMATSAAANGKLEIAERAGKNIPEGWLLDKNGMSAENPAELKEGGMLLPLGSNEALGYHKGFALGAMVDIFSGVLSGANYGPWVPPFVSFLDPIEELPGKGIGHFIGAWSIEGFAERKQFYAQMQQWIRRFKETHAIDTNKPVLIPGEPEYLEESKRKTGGIPLNLKVVESIKRISEQYKIENVEPI